MLDSGMQQIIHAFGLRCLQCLSVHKILLANVECSPSSPSTQTMCWGNMELKTHGCRNCWSVSSLAERDMFGHQNSVKPLNLRANYFTSIRGFGVVRNWFPTTIWRTADPQASTWPTKSVAPIHISMLGFYVFATVDKLVLMCCGPKGG